MKKVVRIGCFSGFWGDSPTAAFQLVSKGNIDYLVGDYLAEVTMGILARLKSSAGSKKKGGALQEGGYVSEFVKTLWEPLVKQIAAKKIKLITNAGGMNPNALKKHMEAVAAKAGVSIKIAAVEGDDFMDRYHDLKAKDAITPFSVENEVESIDESAMMISCNAYLGAFPIAEALSQGAQVVVTGRAVDSAIVVGPLIHEYGWKATDYDLLAAGSVIGHIIECGCHATGGNFTDWELSESFGWDDVGYPIAECFADGSAIITKPEETGGVVTVGTVAEQLVYEIMDPAAYYLPDVVVDFRGVTLEELRPNLSRKEPGRVKVIGAKGYAPTPFYKASLTFVKGFKLECVLMIGGIDARRKALATANGIITKTRKIFQGRGWGDYSAVNIEALGAEHSYGPLSRADACREVILRITVVHEDTRALQILSMEISPSALSMAPGITGSGSGRPQYRPNVLYSSCLVKKSELPVSIIVGHESAPIVKVYDSPEPPTREPSCFLMPRTVKSTKTVRVPLIKLCHGRSGDKGDVANIGIICRKKHYFPLISEQLTTEAVKQYMGHLVKGNVYRYSLPGITAFNFVCTKALGGGGMSSLSMDRQGKCYAQMLLDFPIDAPEEWLSTELSSTNNKSKL